MSSNGSGADRPTAFDVVVVGAGFAGLYLLHRLRGLGFSAPGARGRPTTSAAPGTGTATRAPAATSRASTTRTRFDPELDDEWTVVARSTPPQPEILRYLQHVADKHDLRRDIEFSTRVDVGRVGRRRVALDASRPPTGDDDHAAATT